MNNRNKNKIDQKSISTRVSEIDRDNVESVDVDENNEIIIATNKNPRKTRASHSGIGSVSCVENELNKDSVINALVKMNQGINNKVVNLETTKEYMELSDRKMIDLCGDSKVSMLLGEEADKMTFGKYMMLVRTMLPVLDDCNFSDAGTKFCSLCHKKGTPIIISDFLPFFSVNTTPVFDSNIRLKAINVTLVNQLFPSDSINLFGVPGDSSGKIGGDKGILTYAEKLSGTFNFLKTYNFPGGSAAADDLKNLLQVLDEYKSMFEEQNENVKSFIVDGNYRKIWRYMLDTIGHYYLEETSLPSKVEFTIDKLLEALPLELIARNFLKPYDNPNITQELKEFMATQTYIPKYGYFKTRQMLTTFISALIGKRLPIGHSWKKHSKPRNLGNPDNPAGKKKNKDDDDVLNALNALSS